MTPLEIRPLSHAGAEVLGVDVTTLTVGDWNQIQAAFAAYGLLVFRDQILSEHDHSLFAERWGTPEISRTDSSTLPTNGEHGPGQWSSVASYVPQPPLGTVEVLRKMPANPVIKFASTYAAFDGLASTTQRALEALSAEHRHLDKGTTHPIVIHHPVSGRKAIYLNPTFTTSVVDMEEEPGLVLLNQLFEHILSPEYIETVEWEVGTAIVCDSRAMLSFAGGFKGAGRTDTIVIAGCPLRPAIAPEKRDPSFAERAGATLAGGILTAAMTGIAEVIDPERKTHDIEIVSDAPERQPLTGLEFGDLDPLD